MQKTTSQNLYQSSTTTTMHGTSCPKCGAASDGSSKSCGSCGAVSPPLLLFFFLLFQVIFGLVQIYICLT
ncbi:hypothetical protein QBC46DRAFT_369655 [Diplogelasinospora grovesii]|uniref:Uncharacterized protein n=1 Tax=Diplogelasinospora grovesii TaxID=303347 RepID=A0AAN6NIF6_9PEZI|nr:hypothetical protein QBC46DRAFT_369655 [Diplogelasinospora grovesii]